MILGSEFQKSYFGFGMSLSIIPCVLILRKTDNIDFFGPNLAKKEFWSQKSGFGISTSKIACMPVFRQNDSFDFFDPNLPKKEF